MTALTTQTDDTLTVEDTLDQVAFRHLVRQGFEWMEVTCAPHLVEEHGSRRIAMGLTITSSFGAFGFNYASIGVPNNDGMSIEDVAVSFLANILKEELLSKIVEDKPEVFDLDATRAHMARVSAEVIDGAKEYPQELAEMTEAKTLLEDLFEELESSGYHPAVQAHLLYDSPHFHAIAGDDAWEDIRYLNGDRRMREAEGLFDKLWVPYQDYLCQSILAHHERRESAQ